MRRPGLAPLLLYALFVGLHLALGAGLDQPRIYEDELVHLGVARYLALGYGFPESLAAAGGPDAWASVRGYSLLLVPIHWLVTDPAEAYRAALVVNALVSSVTPVAASWLAKRLRPELSAATALTIGALVGLYPPFLIYSTWAMAENVLVPALLLACVAAARASERRDWAAWLVFGAANGLLYVFHARCAPIVMAAALVASRQLWPLRQSARPMGAFLAGLGLGLSPSWVLHAALAGAGRHAPSLLAAADARRVAAYGDGALWIGLAGQVGGQVLYAIAATAGVFVVGMGACLAATFRRPRGERDAGGAVLPYVALSFAGNAVLASVFTTTFLAGNPGMFLSFGRHGEHILAPALVVGLTVAAMPDFRAATLRRSGAASLLALTLAAVLLWIGTPRSVLDLTPTWCNVLGLFPFIGWLGRFSLGAVWLAAAGAMLAVLLARLRSARAGALACASLFLAEAAIVERGYVRAQATLRAGQRDLPAVVDEVTRRLGVPRAEVAYDGALYSRFHHYSYEYFLPAHRMPRTDSRDPTSASPAFVISARLELEASFPGARPVLPERGRSHFLWILRGPLQARAEQAGLLLPPGFPRALPDAAFRSRLRFVRGTRGASWETSQTAARVIVRIRHAGGGSPWPSAAALASAPYAVRLGLLTFAAHDMKHPVAEGRVDLPRSLLPGESADVEIDPRAVTPVRPLARGTHYRVVIGPLQESVGWFFEKGDKLLPLSIRW
ncbi:MAG: glycosyltransferase family 39 protein [Myxococcota bacterium]